MVDLKTLKDLYGSLINFFKDEKGEYDTGAITMTIINTVASFFFLNAAFGYNLDLTQIAVSIRMAWALYILFGLALAVFVILVMTLQRKFVRFNIDLFLFLYFIFQLPTIDSVTAVFFILVAITLHYYPHRQQLEIDYAKKINIHRRIGHGLVLIILVASLSMAFGMTRNFEKYEINEVIDYIFIDHGTVHGYIGGTYNKYFQNDKFYKTLDDIEAMLDERPEDILKMVGSLKFIGNLPVETINSLDENAMLLLNSQATEEETKNIIADVKNGIAEIRREVSSGNYVDRIINMGVGQVKTLIAPYDLYVRFYIGYSVFAVLVLLSPFLLVLITWLSEIVYHILRRNGVLKVKKVSETVEYIETM